MRMRNHSYFGQNKMINDRFYDESAIHYNVAAMHGVEIQKQSLQAEVLFDPYKRKSRFSFNVTIIHSKRVHLGLSPQVTKIIPLVHCK